MERQTEKKGENRKEQDICRGTRTIPTQTDRHVLKQTELVKANTNSNRWRRAERH